MGEYEYCGTMLRQACRYGFAKRSSHAAEWHHIWIADHIFTYMNTVGAYAQSPGTLPKWARAKIHVVLGMQIEFVRPSLQRFEHFQQTAKAKRPQGKRPCESGYWDPRAYLRE